MHTDGRVYRRPSVARTSGACRPRVTNATSRGANGLPSSDFVPAIKDVDNVRTKAPIGAAVVAALILVGAPASADHAPTPETTSAPASGVVEAPAPPMAITWAAPTTAEPATDADTPADAPADTPADAPAGETSDSAGVRPDEGATGPGAASARAAAPAPAAATEPASAEFALQFDATATEPQRHVFEEAARIWAGVLEIRVPVTVAVTFDALPPGALGGAAPTSAWLNHPSFPDRDVAYVVALANQHAGADLDPGVPDIDVVISNEEPFYEGADENVPSDRYSLLLLALHELGHGLGHTTWARETSPGNFAVRDGGIPLSYDRFVATSTGRPITVMGSAELRSALRSPLYWVGPEADRVSGPSIPLYTPSSWEQGSSVGHLDDPCSLMFPFLCQGDSATAIPTITVAMLADVGWPLPPVGRQAFGAAITRDFLDRYATPDELRTVDAQLRAGVSRLDIVRSYAFSDEWVGALIDGYYQSTLGRQPDANGRNYWIGVIKGGTTPAAVAAYFYASAEYFTRAGGTNSRWVADLYEEILHRQPDASGHAYWRGLADRGVGRDVIALDFYQSIESRRDRVKRLYRDLLGRIPDAGGHAYWAEVLTNGRDVDLAIFLAGSDEYYQRSLRRFG